MRGEEKGDRQVQPEGGAGAVPSGPAEYAEPHKGVVLVPVLAVALVLWLVFAGIYGPEALGIPAGQSDAILLMGAFFGLVVPLGLRHVLSRRPTGSLVLDEDGVERRAADGRRMRIRWPEVTSLRWGGFIPQGIILSDARGSRRLMVSTYFDDFDEIVERVVGRTVDAHQDDPARLSPPSRFWRTPRGWLQLWAVALAFGLPSFLISFGWTEILVLSGGLLAGQLAVVSRITVEDGTLLERGAVRWRRTPLRSVEEVQLVPPRVRRGGRATDVDLPAVELRMSPGQRMVVRTASALALWAAVEAERRRVR